MKGIITCLLLVLALQGLQASDWSISIKRMLGKEANTAIYLAYAPDQALPKTFLIQLNIRLTGKFYFVPRAYLQREIEVEANAANVFRLDLQLPEDNTYLIDAEILDQETNVSEYVQVEQPYINKQERQDIQASDIVLSYEPYELDPFAKPFIGDLVPATQKELYFAIHLRIPFREMVPIWATLFRDQSKDTTQNTRVFQSVREKNFILELDENGEAVIQDRFDLSFLPEGKYKILIIVNREQGSLDVVDREIEFIRGSDLMERVMQDLPTAIRMMEYIAPLDRLDTLLNEEDPVTQRTEFENTWEELYPNPQQKREEMEGYYRRIFISNDRYAEDKPGWQTDRGKIYMLYGEPQPKFLSIDGKEFLRWTYAKWSLSFLFEKRNQYWTLVE